MGSVCNLNYKKLVLMKTVIRMILDSDSTLLISRELLYEI